jgi:hypothetical protein
MRKRVWPWSAHAPKQKGGKFHTFRLICNRAAFMRLLLQRDINTKPCWFGQQVSDVGISFC